VLQHPPCDGGRRDTEIPGHRRDPAVRRRYRLNGPLPRVNGDPIGGPAVPYPPPDRGAKQEEVTAMPSSSLMWPAPYVSVLARTSLPLDAYG
jgi:hypothetical protein